MGLLARIKKSLIGDGDSAHSEERASAATANPALAPAPASRPAPQQAHVPSAEAASGAAAGTEEASEVLSALNEKIVELSGGQLSPDVIDPGAALFDFGYVDSLSAVTLIGFIDSEYGVAVSELDLVGSLDNLQALAEHIQNLRAS